MRNRQLLASFVLGFALGLPPVLHAQSPGLPPSAATNSAAPSHPDRMLGFLSESDRAKYTAAHDKALARDPALQAESDALQTTSPPTRDPKASPQDRLTLHEKRIAFRQKLRAAMLQEDASLTPIFEQIDQHQSQMRAQFQKTNNAPASPTP